VALGVQVQVCSFGLLAKGLAVGRPSIASMPCSAGPGFRGFRATMGIFRAVARR